MAGTYPKLDKFTSKVLPNPNRPVTESVVVNSIISKFDSGHEQRRIKGTPLMSWEFTYEYLTDTAYRTLRDFFIAKLNVESFTWTHPVSKVTYTVRFNMDTLQAENVGHNLRTPIWKLPVKLIQVL